MSGIVWAARSTNGRLLWRYRGGITAIQLTTGEKLWHKDLAAPASV